MIKVIYSIFLGLLLAVFVGVTVSTFYPAPEYPEYPAELKAVTPDEDSAEVQNARIVFDAQQEAYQEEMSEYNRNVFAIILACSIIMLVISLAAMKQVSIIADGVLLGGALTLLYAIARGLMSDDGLVRFVVVLVGLIIALVLGYIKFIKPEKKAAK